MLAGDLAEAGVPVTVRRYAGMIHEFLRHPFDAAEVAIGDASAALRAVFDAAADGTFTDGSVGARS